MNRQRIQWLDVAKGIGIILVILSHCVPYGGFTFKLIFSFHMPLFFFLSGYLFEKSEMKTVLCTKVKRLLVPFIIYMALGLFFTILIPTWREELTVKGIIRDIYLMSPDVCNNSSIWFLSCLFLVYIMFNGVCLMAEKWNNNMISVVLIVFFGIIGFVMGIPSVMNILPANRLPFALDTAFTAIVFFAVGYVYKKTCYNPQNLKLGLQLLILFGAILLLLGCVMFNGKVNIHSLTFKNPIIYYIGSFAGIMVIIMLSIVIEQHFAKKIINVLSYYGKNSLTILGTQSILIRLYIFLTNMLFDRNVKLYHQPVISGIVCWVLITWICVPLCCEFASCLRKRR